MKFSESVTCLLLALGLSQAASASQITIDFQATIDSVGSDVTGLVSVGDPVSGTFSYDTTMSPVSASAVSAQYFHDPTTVFSITLGGITLDSTEGGSLFVGDGELNGSATNPSDTFLISGDVLPSDLVLNGHEVVGMSFGLYRDNLVTGQLWSDVDLPEADDWVAVTIADINRPDWHWLSFDVPGATLSDDIRWKINSLEVYEDGELVDAKGVPEPAVLWLHVAGFLGLAGFAGHRAKI